jgi:hypothetical protein
MILKLLFFAAYIGVLFHLVRKDRLSLDLASAAFILILFVLGLSFSPFWVERIAAVLNFSTPAMTIVALTMAGLISLCLVLAVTLSDLIRRQGLLMRQLALFELRLSSMESELSVRAESKMNTAKPNSSPLKYS